MKELLKQFASYNLWANEKLTELILTLPEEKQKEFATSSFSSLHDTLLHMWNVESIWWQRLKLQEKVIAPSENFSGTTKDLVNALLQQCRLWEDWVSAASDVSLEHVFQYYNLKKESFKQPTWQMLLHVFNHGTYHRGQLVTMLRQLGVEKIPQTDLIVFTRKK
ncbi:MAG: DNA polymerase [Chitinophagaceae bacterium]